MKKDQVPQQANKFYDGETKAVYAVNEEGKLEISETSGWDAEEVVLEQALDEIHRQAQEALQRVQTGMSSPLEYHMYAQRMDLPMLAKAVGLFQWRVKRHFSPKRFDRLPQKRIELYAAVLGLSIDDLKSIPEHQDFEQ